MRSTARRLLSIVVIIVTLLVPACSAGESPSADGVTSGGAPESPGYVYTDVWRFGLVAGNAFKVAYPDHLISNEDELIPRESGEMAVQVDVDSPLKRLGEAGSPERYVIRQDHQSGGVYVSTVDERRPVPTTDTHDGLGPRVLERTSLTRALQLIGVVGRDAKKGRKSVDEILGNLGRAAAVTAVVELTHPMAEEKVRDQGYVRFTNALFSPGGKGVPIYWDNTSPLFCDCSPDGSLTSRFRSWVASLRAEDGLAVKGFGLSLSELNDAAKRGEVHGFIEYNVDPRSLRLLLKRPHVRMIHLVEARMNCELENDACDPVLWPKRPQLYGVPN